VWKHGLSFSFPESGPTEDRMKVTSDKLLLVVDLLGTFLFALEGAMTALEGNLDFFGVLVLAFTTALGGGIIRDLLIGAVPPASIQDRRYAITALVGGATVFFFHHFVRQIPASWIIVLDAAGLGLFAMAGAVKALDKEIDPFMAVLMGTITGVGGGTLRDIFLARIPAVLQVEIYAVAALIGSAVMVVGIRRNLPRTGMMALGGVVCFLVRIVSVWQHWNLPKVPSP
jgi:uncharacterized membrane protein YeiH